MNDKIQLKRGTLANWLKADPVLMDGEMALVATDASKPTVYDSKKVGDGTHKFSELEMLGYECLQELGDSQQFPMSQKAITDWINKGYQFRGVATPSTNPGTPDGPIFYFATKAGIYANFNSISVADGEVVILQWDNGAWTKKTTGFAAEQEIIYDVSARNGGVVFESLQALLSSSNLNTLIPASYRRGGMAIRFIQGSEQSSDNKYVQYRLMSDTFNTTPANWQGVDDEPTVGSDNLVKSGGVADAITYEVEKFDSKLSDLTSTISYLNCDSPSIFIQGGWGKGIFTPNIKNRISLNGIRHGINLVLKEGYKITACCWFKDDGIYISDKPFNVEIDYGYLCLSIGHVDNSDISTDEYPFESCSLGLNLLSNNRYNDLSKLKYCIPEYEIGKSVSQDTGVIGLNNNRAIIKNISMPTMLKVGDGYSIYNAVLFRDNLYYSTELMNSLNRKEAQLLKCINQCYYYVTINKNDGTKFTEDNFKDAIVEFSRDYVINQNMQKSIEDNLYPDLITIEGSAPDATTGRFNLTSGYKRTDFIPVDLIGEKGIEFKNTGSSSLFASYYYDANKRPISKVFQSTGVIEKGIIQKADIPENCAYIVLIFPNKEYDISCRILNSINEVVYSNIDTFLLKEKTPYILFDNTYLCNNSFINNYKLIEFDIFKNVKFKAMEVRWCKSISISFRDKSKNQLAFYTSSSDKMSTTYIPFEGLQGKMNKWEKLASLEIKFDEGTIEELSEYYIKLYYNDEVCDKNLDGFDNFVSQYAQRWSNFHCLPYMAKNYNKGNNDKYYFNLFIDTDTHKETNNIFRRVLQWCRYAKVRNTNPIYISLGDFGQYLPDNRKPQSKTVWKSYMKSIFDVIDTYGYNTSVPQLFTVGNHDTNQEKNNWGNIEYFANKSDLYENIFKPMLARYSSNHTQLDTENKFTNYKKIGIVTDSENNSPTYYYFDSEEHKVRVIVCNVYDIEDSELSADLNSNSGDNSEAYVLSQMQLDFIYNAMKGAEEKGYCVILCGHNFSSTNSMNVLRDFAIAYRNKTTATSTLNSTNKIYNIDFSRANGKIFYLQGHGHKFVRSKYKNTNIGTLEVDNFMTIATCGSDTHFLRNVDEDCFDILCYDDSEGIKFVRYGNANGMYDSNNNDGSDSNGFHFVDSPIKF